jgi:hypothetical protein
MISPETLRSLALSLPEATEAPHFEKTSFRVRGKIFATYDPAAHRASLKLSAIDQDVFTAVDRTLLFPVPNQWGRQGWTLVDLSRVEEALLADALAAAYCNTAPKKLAAMVPRREQE